MKILEIKDLALEGVQVVRFGRFLDDRGYFTEHYRKSDLAPRLDHLPEFVQCNESFSRAGTIRGLHFQWSPYMGKLVRTLSGRMVDFILDIRKGSPTFGKIIAYDLPANRDADYDEWIWMPPGFAHGNVFPEDTLIEYFCTGEYSPSTEAGISPFAPDLDWSMCAPELKRVFDEVSRRTSLVTEKDRNGYTLAAWTASPLSDNFIYPSGAA
ncbi:MAG TPA: dTDP-4-dehydrorhamnose 3,5-epimerase family protein [Dehalococcoidia bacterium]|nr:dTDP-4-dehydrorhamnose 3,5-epimerase family protein [Dehalococcoidia bacterium]